MASRYACKDREGDLRQSSRAEGVCKNIKHVYIEVDQYHYALAPCIAMKRMMKAASAAAGVRGIKPRQKQNSGVSDLLKDQVQVSLLKFKMDGMMFRIIIF